MSPELALAEAEIPVVDLHVDLPYQIGYKGASFARGSGDFRAETLVPSGLVGVVLPLFVPTRARPSGRTLAEFEASYARVFDGISKTPPYSLPGCRVERAGGEARRVSTWLSFEGAEPLEPTREELGSWVMRGVRLFGLVHTEHNRYATSSGEPSTGQGLTEQGRRFVELILDFGGILDVSHASDEATDELIGAALRRGAPVVASHSNARALAAHPRNLTDRQIREIARSGGVIGVNFHQSFLNPRSRQASLEDVVRQIRHLVKIGGIEVVAIGSDYEGGIRPVPELAHAGRYQTLARALLRADFSEEEVRRMLSGNALRVLCGSR